MAGGTLKSKTCGSLAIGTRFKAFSVARAGSSSVRDDRLAKHGGNGSCRGEKAIPCRLFKPFGKSVDYRHENIRGYLRLLRLDL
jgi:hypothetical protein